METRGENDEANRQGRAQEQGTMLPTWAHIFLSKEPVGFCSPSQLSHVRGLGGPGMGLVAPVPSCAPPRPHLPVQEGGGRRERAQLDPLLAEGLEPDRVSGTWAQRVGDNGAPWPGYMQSVTLSSAFCLLLRCPNQEHILVLVTLSCRPPNQSPLAAWEASPSYLKPKHPLALGQPSLPVKWPSRP